MKFTELIPRFVGAGGPGITDRSGSPVPERRCVGVSFECPCVSCGTRCYVPFRNPLDGGPPIPNGDEDTWQRTGEDLDTLTLAPSIYRSDGCGWHGWVENGVVRTV